MEKGMLTAVDFKVWLVAFPTGTVIPISDTVTPFPTGTVIPISDTVTPFPTPFASLGGGSL